HGAGFDASACRGRVSTGSISSRRDHDAGLRTVCRDRDATVTAIGAGAPSPRLGIHLRNFSTDGAEGWAGLVERAVAADRAGIDKLVVSDHVAFGEALEEYARPEVGGVRGGRQPTGPDGHWLEP